MKLLTQFTLLSLFCLFSFHGNSQSNYSATNEIYFLQRVLDDSLRIVTKQEQFGLIDKDSNALIPPVYDEFIIDFKMREGILVQKRFLNEYFYFYWEYGYESEEVYNRLKAIEEKIPTSPYNLIKQFRANPRFVVRKGNKWGVVNKTNAEIIPIQYNFVQEVGQDLYWVKNDEGKSGLINADNQFVVPVSADSIILIPNYEWGYYTAMDIVSYALYTQDGKWGIVDLFSHRKLPPKYDEIEHCYYLPDYDCLCMLVTYGDRPNNSLSGFKGRHKYANVIRYRIGDKYGLISTAGMKEVTPAIYEGIRFNSRYRGDIADNIVQLDGKCTFFTTGNVALYPERFDCVMPLDNPNKTRYRKSDWPFYTVVSNGYSGVIDRNGKIHLDMEWDDVKAAHQMADTTTYQFIVKRRNKFGVIDSHQDLIIPVKYDSINVMNENGLHYFLYRKSKLKKIYVDGR